MLHNILLKFRKHAFYEGSIGNYKSNVSCKECHIIEAVQAVSIAQGGIEPWLSVKHGLKDSDISLLEHWTRNNLNLRNKKPSLSPLERMQRYMSGFWAYTSYVQGPEIIQIPFQLLQPWKTRF